jgi:hypothetical protein
MWWRQATRVLFPKRAEQAAGRVLHDAVDGLNDVADYLRYDPVPPFWRELRGYSWQKLRADSYAAVMIAIVTIPQAVGFALVVGLPVQAVLATAIVGAAVCAVFSTSYHLVFGPTNTISIILAGALLTVSDIPLTSSAEGTRRGVHDGDPPAGGGFLQVGQPHPLHFTHGDRRLRDRGGRVDWNGPGGESARAWVGRRMSVCLGRSVTCWGAWSALT